MRTIVAFGLLSELGEVDCLLPGALVHDVRQMKRRVGTDMDRIEIAGQAEDEQGTGSEGRRDWGRDEKA